MDLLPETPTKPVQPPPGGESEPDCAPSWQASLYPGSLVVLGCIGLLILARGRRLTRMM